MERNVKELWAKTSLYVWPEPYWLISLPLATLSEALLHLGQDSKDTKSFVAIVVEKDEVSLTLSNESFEKLSSIFINKQVAGTYKVITLNLNIDLNVCGYLLPVAKLLADNNISIVPQCGYLKDHLVIKEQDCKKTIEILTRFIQECQIS